ncbi:hypothetical protein GCM10010140_20740 [Streptosporangium pseudovulgare]|uniref:Type II toxin-antitoxin system PemK/MazF family toxin n=1 Tax=Streptosporangium pseudovulgare TaxID=35765 RepID=A0ABQ2QRD1_9ACTN|nr:hypothetical protein GCM10010140_20740 [Streptosporangium pseudovulgare]
MNPPHIREGDTLLITYAQPRSATGRIAPAIMAPKTRLPTLSFTVVGSIVVLRRLPVLRAWRVR